MFNFEYKRSFLEAFGFYVFWCIILTLVVIMLLLVLSFFYVLFFEFNMTKLSQTVMQHIIGTLSHYVTILICIVITFLIIDRKKLYNIFSVFLFLITAFLCFYSSALYGFVFTSILTMLPNKTTNID